MTRKYVPAWKDKDGNRLFRVATNYVFDSWQEAFEYQAGDFIFYVPFGWSPNGIIELDVTDEGRADIEHVVGDHPMLGVVAIIGGPQMVSA